MFSGSFSLNTVFPGVFRKLLATSEGTDGPADQRRDVGTSIDHQILDGKLKFHPVHGKEVVLLEHCTTVERNESYYDHSVVFSHRPVAVNEIISVEITRISPGFCGPLKIGFTCVDPNTFQSPSVVPLGRVLQDTAGVWLKGVLEYPLEVGSTVHYAVNNDGSVFYGINGVEAGVFTTGVDTSKPLWTILEPYGRVGGIKIVDNPIVFTHNRPAPTNEQANNENASSELSNTSGVVGQRSGEKHNCFGNMLSLFRKRSATQVQNSTCSYSTSPYEFASSPANFVVVPKDFFEQGLCIICMEREKNTAFTKCGHLCMCYECADKFIKRRPPLTCTQGRKERSSKSLCPICRLPISSLLRVYT